MGCNGKGRRNARRATSMLPVNEFQRKKGKKLTMPRKRQRHGVAGVMTKLIHVAARTAGIPTPQDEAVPSVNTHHRKANRITRNTPRYI
jgi:hypothetical protein